MMFDFNNSYIRLPAAFYEPVRPAAPEQPVFVGVNRDLAETLRLDPDQLESQAGLDILSGRQIPEGAEPLAMAYCGHQFGNLVPQLGDGRALLLGEVIDRDGIRRDIQLKGSGRTPFSRGGDGLSALGPVVREFLVSEAMAALGVPTTRALAAVSTGEMVFREIPQPGGVFTRVAKSHIRVGTFQWFAIREDHLHLKQLADYVIDRLYPDVANEKEPYLALLGSVIKRQANLIAQWMSFGFIHGVMNTDNMNVSGETIDYGPCAFMDTYHPHKKFSSIDHGGRYAYGNQASMAHWNLARFAETLLPLIDLKQETAIEKATPVLGEFSTLYTEALARRFNTKIGLDSFSQDDWQIAQSLLNLMADHKADFTLTFRYLTKSAETGNTAPFMSLFGNAPQVMSWFEEWQSRLTQENKQTSLDRMRGSNPVVIPRNHRVEEAIQAAYRHDFQPFHTLREALRLPFEDRPQYEAFETPPKPEEVVQATFCGT